MSIISDIFSGGATALVDSVGKVLDNVITTKEEKQTLDIEEQKAEMQFKLDMSRLSLEQQQAILGDVQSARQREVQVLNAPNASWFTKNTIHVIAFGTVILAFILFYILIFAPDTISDKSKDVVLYILGIISAILVQIYSYYFGSSAGSAAKDVTIKNMSVP